MKNYQSIFESDFGIQKIKYRGAQGLGLCRLHDDTKPSFSFSIETGLWTCFSGCGSGNTYQFAERLKLPNPHQYIEPSTMDSKNYRTNGYEPNNVLKSEDRQVIEANKMVKYEILKERYGNRVILDHEYKNKYIGKDDDGNVVFIYPKGIKIHKKYWIKEASINSSNQIFMVDELAHFDTSNPLYIFEGEKDALASSLQGISFSAGAGATPDDISQLLVFPVIIIVYDNDEPGIDGAEKLAERIKNESPDNIVKIAQWDLALPQGYDVAEDRKETGFAKVDEAVVNATAYQIPIPKYIGGFRFLTGEEMDNAQPKPLEWYVEDILPKKFNSIIAGTAGSKKSMWAMQLGMSLANGEKRFLDGKISGTHKVLYVDTESGENEVTIRYQGIKKHMDWNGSHNWRMLSKGGSFYDVWDDVIRSLKYFTPDLMIFDCLYNSTAIKEFSKSSGMSDVINALGDFKAKRGIDVMAVHHFVKGNHDSFNIDRMSGSFVLQSWIEYCNLMIKSNEENIALFKQGKSRGAPENNKVYALRWDDYKFKMAGVVQDIAPLMVDKHVKLKYTAIIEDLPERFSNKDWLNVCNQKHSHVSERTHYTWLKDAVQCKLIKKLAKGVYEKHLQLIDETNIGDI